MQGEDIEKHLEREETSLLAIRLSSSSVTGGNKKEKEKKKERESPCPVYRLRIIDRPYCISMTNMMRNK